VKWIDHVATSVHVDTKGALTNSPPSATMSLGETRGRPLIPQTSLVIPTSSRNIPIRDVFVHNGIRPCRNTVRALRFVTDITPLLVHADHDAWNFGPAYNGKDHHARSIRAPDLPSARTQTKTTEPCRTSPSLTTMPVFTLLCMSSPPWDTQKVSRSDPRAFRKETGAIVLKSF